MAEDVLQALVGHVAGEEMTVFFSSHQIAEVDQIADHIAIVDRGPHGRWPARSTICASAISACNWCSRAMRPASQLKSPGVVRVNRQGRVLTVLTRDHEALIAEARPLSPASVDVSPVTLKEIFLESVRTED